MTLDYSPVPFRPKNRFPYVIKESDQGLRISEGCINNIQRIENRRLIVYTGPIKD